MEEFVTFRAGDELLTLPVDFYTKFAGNPRNWRWLTARHVPIAERSDAVARLMFEAYNNRAQRRVPLEYVPWMTPRRITAFQFWLRNRLTRWGLI